MLSEFMTLVRLFCIFLNTAVLTTASFATIAFSTQASAEQTNIAAASNFTHTMKVLIGEFEKTSEHQIKASYGSSGKLYAQIKHGAPFQLLFSADQGKPLALYKEGLTIGKPFTYAFGALALWSSNTAFKNLELQKLQSGEFNKLSLANPKLAPYGIAAMEVLENLELLELTRQKWVQGENIAQTYQFVGTGNADLGFVALSQVINNQVINKSAYWQVPTKLYQPIRQDAVLLKRGKNNAAAKEFLLFIRSEKGQSIIKSYGYHTEDSSLTEHSPIK
jgi:molybdate transport system substrate-binding protein